jgi:D-alanyl-D-alanine carboxypeptidase
MTAYIVFDAWKSKRVDRNSKITISANANAEPKMRLGLGAGKELTYDEAMAALIILSANDIAVALAEAISGSEEAFVAEMNAKAFSLGMYSTRYINPNGLPGPGQYTTAKDLATLTQAIIRDFPDQLGVFAALNAEVAKRTISTHNSVLIGVAGGDGMKTGFTCSAGYNIVASATRNGVKLVAIVLGETSTTNRSLKTSKLLGYGFLTREWKALLPADPYFAIPDGVYDRAQIRAANLDKRLSDCLAPEPASLAPAVASLEKSDSGAIAEWGPEKTATQAVASVAGPKTKAQAKAAQAQTPAKRAGKHAKRRGKKQVAGEADAGAFSLASP